MFWFNDVLRRSLVSADNCVWYARRYGIKLGSIVLYSVITSINSSKGAPRDTQPSLADVIKMRTRIFLTP